MDKYENGMLYIMLVLTTFSTEEVPLTSKPDLLCSSLLTFSCLKSEVMIVSKVTLFCNEYIPYYL